MEQKKPTDLTLTKCIVRYVLESNISGNTVPPWSPLPPWPHLYTVLTNRLYRAMWWPRWRIWHKVVLCFSGLFFIQINFLNVSEWRHVNNPTNTAEGTVQEVRKRSSGLKVFKPILPLSIYQEPHRYPYYCGFSPASGTGNRIRRQRKNSAVKLMFEISTVK